MICYRCALRAARREASSPSVRPFSHSSRRRSTPISANSVTSAPRQGAADGRNPPAVTSTSAAQPFSAGSTPSAAAQGITGKPAKPPAPVQVSSVPAGTPLKGLNFLKNAQDPVALPDEEYPPWLWTLLTPKVKEGSAESVDNDLFAKSKKARRKAAKIARKEAAMAPEHMVQKIPIHEQTIDLPAGDGTVAGALQANEVRGSLTRAMREKRRATIKEANFLKGMS